MKTMNIPYKTFILHAFDHTSYYLGAEFIVMEITFDDLEKLYGI